MKKVARGELTSCDDGEAEVAASKGLGSNQIARRKKRSARSTSNLLEEDDEDYSYEGSGEKLHF